MSQAHDALSDTPLFEDLSEEDTRTMRAMVLVVKLNRGERLFAEGDKGDKLYLIRM